VEVHSREDAIAIYVANRGDTIPEGYYVTATELIDLLIFNFPDDSRLWCIWLDSDDERGIIGDYSTYIGPDGKVWEFPGQFADPEIMKHALLHLYIQEVADLVDPSTLADRVSAITEQRDQAIFSLPDAARRGDLKK